MVVVRLDANPSMGSGHAVRCTAIARELVALGESVSFAVTDGTSADYVRSLGMEAREVGGDPMWLGREDGEALAALTREDGANGVLVDTYAITADFFAGLREGVRGLAGIAYIDDAYTFEAGRLAEPIVRDVDLVVNYGFGFSGKLYRRIYADTGARLFVSPGYAPVRGDFRGRGHAVREAVRRVMVTSGSTNPNRALERMVNGVRLSGLNPRVSVIVGRQATFDEACCDGLDCEVLHDVRDMAGLMESCDVAVSAAGTTLYELACVGVPTIALPVVENQLPNAEGVERSGAGLAVHDVSWGTHDVGDRMSALSDYSRRARMSAAGRSLVDGNGAERIARAIINGSR